MENKKHTGIKKVGKILYNLCLYGFALAGIAIIGAWAFYKLGFTNDRGGIDHNNRYLMDISEMKAEIKDSVSQQEKLDTYLKLAVFGKYYPENARLILHALNKGTDLRIIEQMLAAASIYIPDDHHQYADMLQQVEHQMESQKMLQDSNLIPWMNTIEWECLKPSILKDSADIVKAAAITGVEPRLIVGCLIGEQMRLFNSKREKFKEYLGPVKVLSVQSQFSLGVNGIKDFTARAVENHLIDSTSEFYMGEAFEHILDYATEEIDTERVYRLVDYRSHLYSYIYTGCILHQTMLQWKRAGYDISNRPDILFTLFNVGFSQSKPKPDPQCGGSRVEVNDRLYTFGALGFDFYYSGELLDEFPYQKEKFNESGPSIDWQPPVRIVTDSVKTQSSI